MFHDLGKFVTSRMARFITSQHAKGRAERIRVSRARQAGDLSHGGVIHWTSV
jgi:hypothetical protein